MFNSTYTFVGLREGSAPAVDIQVRDAAIGWAPLARAFLVEHTTCDRVEVWRDQELIATLARADLDAAVRPPPASGVEGVRAAAMAMDRCGS